MTFRSGAVSQSSPNRRRVGFAPGGPSFRRVDRGVQLNKRATLRRWHMWLGWLVGLPMLFWTVSGLVMVARPIEEVRGETLLRDPAPISLSTAAVPPRIEGRAVSSLRRGRARQAAHLDAWPRQDHAEFAQRAGYGRGSVGLDPRPGPRRQRQQDQRQQHHDDAEQ